MIRRTITTFALAAVAAIALASASPAMAAAPPDDTELPTDFIRGGTCTLDTVFGSIPCPDFDWSLGGLTGSEAESDESTPVGGIASDAPIEVVSPGDLLSDAFTPRIDLLPSPTETAKDDGDPDSVGDGLVEVVRPTPEDLRDALDAVLTSPASEASEPVVPTDETSSPGESAVEAAAPDSDDAPEVAEPATPPVVTVLETTTTTTIADAVPEPTTTTDADTAEFDDGSTHVQALPLGSEATDDMDPIAAMLGGVLGTVLVAGLGVGAYRFGHRGQ